jgi:hypothetical protein
MPASPRPCAPGSRGHPPHPRPGLRCIQTRAAPDQILALGNMTQWQPTQNQTQMLAEKTAPRRCPAPGHELTQLMSAEPPSQHPPPAVQPPLFQAVWWPRLGDRPIGPDWVVAQVVGHRSSG